MCVCVCLGCQRGDEIPPADGGGENSRENDFRPSRDLVVVDVGDVSSATVRVAAAAAAASSSSGKNGNETHVHPLCRPDRGPETFFHPE